jgi:hypothetical protein
MTDKEVLERMKSVVGDDYFDWYLEILDDVIANNPSIHYIKANIDALSTLNEHIQDEADGLKGMFVQMKREDKINDILRSKNP